MNRFLPAVAPRLRWIVELGGWLALGFDHVPGRHAILSPGSPDVPRLAQALADLQRHAAPPSSVGVAPFARRWRERIDPVLVQGGTLLHTDLSRRNVLLADDAVHVVDWAMPAVGAAWIDIAFAVVRLIRYGHTPAAAEGWACSIPAWREADPSAVTAWVDALDSLWHEKQRVTPAGHRGPLIAAASGWLAYRRRSPAVMPPV